MARPSRSSIVSVYCVARGARAPDLSRAPRGLPGARTTRSLALGGDLWLVVADVPADRYAEAAVARGLRDLDWVGACAAGHERVVEHVAASRTVVPAKLFTLFEGDERAVAHMGKLAKRLARIADRVDGCAEWGLRVHVDERAARTASRARAAGAAKRTSTGTGFLLRKRAEHTGLAEILRSARTQVERTFGALSASARDAVRRPPVSHEVAARVLLDAVFLVPSRAARSFEAAVARAASTLSKNGCSVTLTGPWPPYHFVSGGRRR
jgi:gas vesicle protein GvpL/GvpF